MSEQGRRASTYENARQIKSEQMRIPIKSAWQGGALPLSYTHARLTQLSHGHRPHLRKQIPYRLDFFKVRRNSVLISF
jgi:hypothetical protein